MGSNYGINSIISLAGDFGDVAPSPANYAWRKSLTPEQIQLQRDISVSHAADTEKQMRPFKGYNGPMGLAIMDSPETRALEDRFEASLTPQQRELRKAALDESQRLEDIAREKRFREIKDPANPDATTSLNEKTVASSLSQSDLNYIRNAPLSP